MKRKIVIMLMTLTVLCTACGNKEQVKVKEEIDSNILFGQTTTSEPKVEVESKAESENVVSNIEETKMTQVSNKEVASTKAEVNESFDYSGHYIDTMGTTDIYSEMIINKNDANSYDVEIGIFRVTTLEGKAVVEDGQLIFTDETMGITGTIEVVKNTSAVFKVTKSDSGLMEAGRVYEFPDIKKVDAQTAKLEEMEKQIRGLWSWHTTFYIPFICGNMEVESGHEENIVPVTKSYYNGEYAKYEAFVRGVYSKKVSSQILSDPRYLNKDGVLYANTDCFGDKGCLVDWYYAYPVEITAMSDTTCDFVATGRIDWGSDNIDYCPVKGQMVLEENGWRLNSLDYE